MVVACILICCEAGKYKDVVSDIKKTKGVKRVFGVHGRWDVVVEVEAPDLKALGEISLKLHGLEGVRATETLISF
ncbi:MAG: Lrp/AsnC ligand binding domain-containing protein [Nitrososphaerota archaeon]